MLNYLLSLPLAQGRRRCWIIHSVCGLHRGGRDVGLFTQSVAYTGEAKREEKYSLASTLHRGGGEGNAINDILIHLY